MIIYHATTPKKIQRYANNNGYILSPVRGFSTLLGAQWWARRVGRSIVLKLEVPDDKTYPLPDHRSPHGIAYWCDKDTKTDMQNLLTTIPEQ